MKNLNLNTDLIKSQKIVSISCVVFAILSNFINLNISIVPAASLLFALYNFEKSILTKNIKINVPFFKFYNYCIPFILTASFLTLYYYKTKYPELPDVIVVILIFALLPTFLYFNKVILMSFNFPSSISDIGLDDNNYKITLDFKNKRFFASNNLITFNSDNIIENTTTNINELQKNKKTFESVIGKDISKFDSNDINLAKVYNY